MFKPMLAGKADLAKIKYPVLCTPKIDGIRCLLLDGEPVSRTLKRIPNHHISDMLKELAPKYPDLDGELIIPGATFSSTTGDIMRHTGEPDFRYMVFDVIVPEWTYKARMQFLREKVDFPYNGPFEKLLPIEIESERALLNYEEMCIKDGYEGAMLRSMDGPYKYGRSTTNEGYLLKLKRFEDSDARVIGVEELMINGNEAKTNALGRTERSSHQENLIPGGKMGYLNVKDIVTGYEFAIGTGFTDRDRVIIWKLKDQYIGKLLKYKHQLSGAKDAPRFPVFLGFREEI